MTYIQEIFGRNILSSKNDMSDCWCQNGTKNMSSLIVDVNSENASCHKKLTRLTLKWARLLLFWLSESSQIESDVCMKGSWFRYWLACQLIILLITSKLYQEIKNKKRYNQKMSTLEIFPSNANSVGSFVFTKSVNLLNANNIIN